MTTKLDYIVVSRLELPEFEAKVTELINDGWSLVGGMAAAEIETYDDGKPVRVPWYCQALVKQLSRRDQIIKEGDDPNNLEFEV